MNRTSHPCALCRRTFTGTGATARDAHENAAHLLADHESGHLARRAPRNA